MKKSINFERQLLFINILQELFVKGLQDSYTLLKAPFFVRMVGIFKPQNPFTTTSPENDTNFLPLEVFEDMTQQQIQYNFQRFDGNFEELAFQQHRQNRRRTFDRRITRPYLWSDQILYGETSTGGTGRTARFVRVSQTEDYHFGTGRSARFLRENYTQAIPLDDRQQGYFIVDSPGFMDRRPNLQLSSFGRGGEQDFLSTWLKAFLEDSNRKNELQRKKSRQQKKYYLQRLNNNLQRIYHHGKKISQKSRIDISSVVIPSINDGDGFQSIEIQSFKQNGHYEIRNDHFGTQEMFNIRMKQGLKKSRYKAVSVEDIDVKKFYTKIKPSPNQCSSFLGNVCLNKMPSFPLIIKPI